VRAYAFLGTGATSYLTGAVWPAPGEWLESADRIRACSAEDLAWWLDDELWEVELEGDVRRVGRALTATRGRLVARLEGWSGDIAAELVEVCARRVRDRAVQALEEAGRTEDAAILDVAETAEQIETVGRRLAGGRDGSSALAGLAADVVLYARDAEVPARAAGVAAYIAAFALAGGDKGAPGYQERFEEERAWQAAWLRERLFL